MPVSGRAGWRCWDRVRGSDAHRSPRPDGTARHRDLGTVNTIRLDGPRTPAQRFRLLAALDPSRIFAPDSCIDPGRRIEVSHMAAFGYNCLVGSLYGNSTDASRDDVCTYQCQRSWIAAGRRDTRRSIRSTTKRVGPGCSAGVREQTTSLGVSNPTVRQRTISGCRPIAWLRGLWATRDALGRSTPVMGLRGTRHRQFHTTKHCGLQWADTRR